MSKTQKTIIGLLALMTLPLSSSAEEPKAETPIVAQAQDETPDVPEPPVRGSPTPDYKIAALDTLDIRVFLEKDLTGEYKVASSGSVTLPLVKRVKVVGLTATEVENQLEKALGDFLVEPQVTVTVKSYRKRTVAVLGEVKLGTSIELPAEQKMDIMEAISKAGGFSEKADKKNIKVTRDGKQITLRLDKLLKTGSEDIFPLQPGDVIYVPQRFF